MTFPTIHPATIELLWLQSRGRRRRMLRRFCQPRRMFLSAIAAVLAVAWLGNAALTIWLREAAAPESLRALLTIGLMSYAAWHVTKAAFFRPESPFDWTPAERDLLAAMPFAPRDLVAYQLASVTVTTLFKAGLFALLLLPDLHCLPLGITGLILAMLTLELLRLAIDIVTWGLSRPAFNIYRVAVVSALVAGGGAIINTLVRGNAFSRINPGEGLLDRFLSILIQLNASLLHYVGRPFRPLVELIVADSVTAHQLRIVAAATVTVTLFAASVVWLYATMARRVIRRERQDFQLNHAQSTNARELPDRTQRPSRLSFRRVPRCGGAGPLVWRQSIGARRHWGSLLTAMIAPAVLACIPCFVIADPYIAFLSTTGTVAFYTFLLLPTALRFDFRRDLDRLAILKGLPITPVAATIGQTLTPVLIASVFQCVVLALAAAARGLPPQHVATAMLVLMPLNVLVFALDNLIYLLYPYRINQEGLEIFFRTMLTFTGKGLLFTIGLAVMVGWGFVAAALTRAVAAWTGFAIDAYAVFAAGMIAGPAVAAAAVLYALAHTYARLDPIEGVPR